MLLTPLINGALCNDLASCVKDKMSMNPLSQQNISLSMKVTIHKPSEMPRVPKTAESDSRNKISEDISLHMTGCDL